MARSALNFLGFGSRKAATEDEEEDKKPVAEADPPEDDDDDEPEPEAEADPPEDDDDDKPEPEAKAAVAADRRRIGAIVTAAGPGRIEAALHLALNSDMSAGDASKLLAALPAAAKGSPLATAMAGRSPRVGAGSGAAAGKGKSLADTMQAQLRERGLGGKES
jgi:hypothetical protein